jgi:hypothetical protein
MMIAVYILVSISLGIIQILLAKLVRLKYLPVSLLLFFVTATGAVHYRLFFHGGIGSYELSSIFEQVFSLVMFLFTVFVPISKIMKRRKSQTNVT